MAPSKGSTRGRISLLAGVSLAAATAVAFGGVTLTPTVAKAANECGDPTANGASADVFVCSDTTTFSAITYPATSGNLTLNLQNDVTVTTGGIVVTPTGSNQVTIGRIADSVTGAGDPQIASTSMSTGAVDIRRSDGFNGAININLADTDADDTPLSITGAMAGIYVSNAGSGATNVSTSSGTITATDGLGARLGTVGTGAIIFANGSTLTGTTGAVLFAEGVNATLINNGAILGAVNFLNTGSSTFNNQNGAWVASGVMNMGSGASTFTNAESLPGNEFVDPSPGGTLVVDGTLAFTGLETFNNAHLIVFGLGEDYTSSDGAADDRLVLGTDFTALADGRLMMDLVSGAADQTTCLAAASADCLDIRTFSAAGPGITEIVLNPVVGSATEFADRIVLVDAAGGAITKGQFILSEASPGYLTTQSGIQGIDTGALAYRLVTDESADQVYLAATPGSASALLSQLPGAAMSIWNLTASAMVDRQLELHESRQGGVWLRGASGYVDDARAVDTGTFSIDSGYDQETQGIAVGGDFAGDGWAAGIMAASVDSEINPDLTADFYDLSGYSLGAYGVWSSGPIYIDALVNYLTLDTASTTSASVGEATATGMRGEAAYRLDFGAVSLQPLATLSWTSSKASGLTTADGFIIASDSASALSAALGARLAGETRLGDLTARFSFTARAWAPVSQDETTTTIEGAASHSFTYDDNADLLGDLAFAARLGGWGDRLALRASAGLKFKEDREAGELLVGLRYRF